MKKVFVTIAALLGTTIASDPTATAGLLDSNIKNSQVCGESNPAEHLSFVFEVVRHGARAPIINMDIDLFPETVAEGILTAEGMRQRYLLGRYHRERYTETFPLLSPEYDPHELYI